MSIAYTEQMFSLKGKTAVVTGGGGTLGSAMGAGFARAGANVILWDVRQEALDARVKQLAEACGDSKRTTSVVVDLMSEESIRKALDVSSNKFGKVDILLNACGGNRGKAPLAETKMDDFEFVLKLNLLAGCFTPMKIVGEYWIKNKIKGSVINIASMAAFIPLSGVWAYDSAKAAVVNVTRAAAKEFAPYGIRVNAIAPGFFLADQNRALLMDEKTGQPTERGKLVLSKTPFRRFGEPDELCGVSLFLASDVAAGFVSGATVPVDGAYLCDSI